MNVNLRRTNRRVNKTRCKSIVDGLHVQKRSNRNEVCQDAVNSCKSRAQMCGSGSGTYYGAPDHPVRARAYPVAPASPIDQVAAEAILEICKRSKSDVLTQLTSRFRRIEKAGHRSLKRTKSRN